MPARILEASPLRTQNAGVDKTIHSRQSKLLQQALSALRTKAKLTQRGLAAKLGRERSLVGRLELGERRLDMVEFFWLCQACNANPVKEASRLMRRFKDLQSSSET